MSEKPIPLKIQDKHAIKRFEKVREEFYDPDVPTPTDKQVVEGLIDTYHAVKNGYYTETTKQD